MLPTMPAHAQFWVASFGSGTTCSRTLPCLTFQVAHDHAAAGGVIKCVDSADFGPVLINKSITIDCTGTDAVINVPDLVNAMNVAVQISTFGVAVTLRKLNINGRGIGTSGILFTGGSALHVENCRISDFRSTFEFPAGIDFHPGPNDTAKLYVSDSVIDNNGAPTFGEGISIRPGGGPNAVARVVLNRVRVMGNTHGIVADGTDSIGSSIVHVRDSVVSGSLGNGIWALSNAGAAPAGMVVDRTSSTDNAGTGILAQGTGALIHIGSSTVVGNGAGFVAQNGDSVSTYQNNRASGNSFDGAASGVLTVK
jgi:hypothetical protein